MSVILEALPFCNNRASTEGNADGALRDASTLGRIRLWRNVDGNLRSEY
jgi:hypothetical protein